MNAVLQYMSQYSFNLIQEMTFSQKESDQILDHFQISCFVREPQQSLYEKMAALIRDNLRVKIHNKS
jgi:hypothetical protein